MALLGSGGSPIQLGVDIGSTSLKLVQMSRDSRDRWWLDGYALEPLASNSIVDGKMLDTDEISSSIRSALKKYKLKAKNAIACVHYSGTITKTLQNSHQLSDRELAHWVAFEVEKFVPYSVDELSLDFYHPNGQDGQDIRVVACRKQEVDNLADCLQASGLEPIAVDVSSYALGRALKQVLQGYAGGGMNALSALVEIGATATRYSVFNGEEMLFHHDLHTDTGSLIQFFSDIYRLPLSTAESQFLQNRLPESFTEKVLRPYLKQVIGDIQRGKQYFEASDIPGRIGQIFLAGGAARIKGIDRVLRRTLGLDVYLLDVSATVGARHKLETRNLGKLAPQLALASGLAMWEGPSV